jgi:NAD(P)-dependent dehydrogenase (short-subunit alcohol dehydrogenase family)
MTRMGELTGKAAIITGAAQGIGAQYARGLAAAGAAVSVCDIADPAALVSEIRAAGGKVMGSIVDITDGAAVRAFAEQTHAQLGSVDILVNNAALFGTLKRKPLMEIDAQEWDRVMTVNVRGPFECVKAVTPFMRAKGYGKIINISSSTVNAGQPLLLHYVSSKGAIIAMTRSLARELGGDGIRVNAVSPGFTLSDAVRSNPVYTREVTSGIAAMRSLRRDQHPDDLVGTVVFLASPASDFITGQTLIVDGGMSMN